MQPYYERSGIRLYRGDCREVVPSLGESFSAVCTDPPYGLSFMGRDWDHAVPGVAFWEAFRDAMTPGAHLLAFGGSRTYHRIAVAIEDAGFEIRDTLQWLYGQGFPKSLDVSKAIDKARREDEAPRVAVAARLRDALESSGKSRAEIDAHFGTANVSQYWFSPHRNAQVPPVDKWPWLREFLDLHDANLDAEVWRLNGRKGKPGDNWDKREVIGKGKSGIGTAFDHENGTWAQGSAEAFDITAPATDAAREWQGWHTALKPAHEPVICAVKPYQLPGDYAIIDGNLSSVAEALCERIAKSAEPSSPRTLHGSDGARASTAPTPAPTSTGDSLKSGTQTGPAGDTNSVADTSASTSDAANIALSMISSWRRILADACDVVSRSTTEMASSLTTDLRTWSLSLSRITPDSMLRAVSHPSGWIAPVSTADELSSAVAEKLRAIQLLTAPAPVTEVSNLTPDNEPIILARKPLSGTVAANVLAHGTGALNIDASRVGSGEDRASGGATGKRVDASKGYSGAWSDAKTGRDRPTGGRWPANVLMDEAAAAQLDRQSGERKGRVGMTQHGSGTNSVYGTYARSDQSLVTDGYPDTGGASRFFPVLPIDDPDTLRMLYTPKASRRERNAGLDGLPESDALVNRNTVKQCANCDNKVTVHPGGALSCPCGDTRPVLVQVSQAPRANTHPTVKPLALMRWLLTLVTPPGGTVLDPFAGSGTTGVAAAALGIPCVLIEQEAEYLPIIAGRIDHALDARAGAELPLFAGVAD